MARRAIVGETGGTLASDTEPSVAHALALVRAEEEQLVVQDRAAEGGAEGVAVKRRSRDSRGVEEKRVGVPGIGLVILIGRAVKIVGSGLGGHGDMCAAIRSLRKSRTSTC